MAKKPSDVNPSTTLGAGPSTALRAGPSTALRVNIVVTVNHVYLPLDEHGNGRADWADAQVTTRVDKRARLKVPADLAKFLSDRDQVEIL